MAQSSVTLMRTAFPLYSINMISNRYMMISGGGGAANTGVLNTIEVYEMISEKGSCVLQKVLTKDTGRRAPMNISVRKLKSRYFVAVGLDDDCAVYNFRENIVGGGGDYVPLRGGLRDRKKMNYSFKDEKNEEMSLIKVKAFQTDTKGYQKCVMISSKSDILCTGGVDGFLRIRQLPSLNLLFDIEAHTNEIDDLCVNPIDNTVVTISKDCRAYLWSSVTGKKITELKFEGATKTYRFRNCRFGVITDHIDKRSANSYAVYTTHIPAVRAVKPKCAYVAKWLMTAEGYKKELSVSVKLDLPSALAISDDGIYLGLGYLSGKVSVHIAYSLQKIYEVVTSHSIFVTGIEFAPTAQHSRALTGDHDFTLFSIAADNELKIHQHNRRMYSMLWPIVIGIIVIYLMFWLMCYFGI